MLKDILNKFKELGILIKPFGVEEEELIKNNKECIVYNYSPVATSKRFILTIRIIAPTLSKCLEVKEEMESKLLGIGDEVKVKNATFIEFEGGSSAFEHETGTTHLIFNINVVGK